LSAAYEAGHWLDVHPLGGPVSSQPLAEQVAICEQPGKKFVPYWHWKPTDEHGEPCEGASAGQANAASGPESCVRPESVAESVVELVPESLAEACSVVPPQAAASTHSRRQSGSFRVMPGTDSKNLSIADASDLARLGPPAGALPCRRGCANRDKPDGGELITRSMGLRSK
jgi:hypothetical protein